MLAFKISCLPISLSKCKVRATRAVEAMVLTSMYSKNVWRARMLETRSQLGPEKTSQFNREISKNLLFVFAEGGGLGSAQNKPVWAGYKSFRWEADPSQAVIESAAYLRWAYPQVLSDADLAFFEPAPKDALWTKNAWGLWEPDTRTSTRIEVENCRGILVPGLAFDRQGHRLGYGKGYYDRTLAGFKGLKVGVAFSVQVTEETLPCDRCDAMMDIIVTEAEIIRVRDQRH